MPMPVTAGALAVAFVAAMATACAALAAPVRIPPALRPFTFDGTRGIIDPEHFGIVGGRVAAGIDYRDAAAVQGIWAPPYVSSDFRLNLRVFGRHLPSEPYTWLPFAVARAGSASGVSVQTTTVALDGKRALVLEVTLRSARTEPVDVPLEVSTAGSADRSPEWGFARPVSSTSGPARVDGSTLALGQAGPAVRVAAPESRGAWDLERRTWSAVVRLAPRRAVRLHFVVALGSAAAAERECSDVAAAPAAAVAATWAAWSRRADELFSRLPRLEASDPRLVAFYNRSLVHLLTNRWDAPDFVLQPYYSTGSVNGGCVCSYLWNHGEVWEILPVYDPAAARAHILHFLKIDISTHFAFDPITGGAFGPWYPVNQEKILGSIYHYVTLTGDTTLLAETVNGRAVRDWVIHHATLLDDTSQLPRMIDYGPSNSHLELRRGIPYNHVMPDLNGRRYQGYLWAEQLCAMADGPAPWLGERARHLKEALRRELWDPDARWFAFIGGDGRRDLRYTVQVLKLFGSGVLDDEQERGLLSHLNEREFLSAYGLHSMAKTDRAYDQVDIDNGGGGACTCFPPQEVEKLYSAGHAELASDMLERILWWGARMPYWGDSLVADAPGYRKDTPLQCTLDGATGAQAIIFGMCGVRVEPDGTITVNPRPPACSPRIALRGLKVRGKTLDIVASGPRYRVVSGGRTFRARVGEATRIPR